MYEAPSLKKALKKTKKELPYEAFSFVIVPREPWAPKRESPIVSLFGAHVSLLYKAALKGTTGKASYKAFSFAIVPKKNLGRQKGKQSPVPKVPF